MHDLHVNDYLRQHMRTVPDWPAPGVQFRDITPLLPAGATALMTVAVNFIVDWMLHRSSGLKD